MRRFGYLEPTTLREAVSMLDQYKGKTKILAGGTNLIPEMRFGRLEPNWIINIKTIKELANIYEDNEGIHIAALIPISDLAPVKICRSQIAPPILVKRIPTLFRRIVGLMATPQVRNIATIPGNLAWGSPAADCAPPLLALDARLKLYGFEGEKIVPLDGFFLGPGKTILKENEIITEVIIPSESLKKVGMSHKFSKRKANSLAVCSTSVSFSVGGGNSLKDVRIAVGAVAPFPMRIKKAESFLEGKAIEKDLLKKIREIVSEEITPITDLRSIAWFRKEITPLLVERCITEAVA